MQRTTSAVVLLVAACLAPQVAMAGVPCTIDVTTAPTPAQLVERAALILHVRAGGYCGGAEATCTGLPNSVVTPAGSQSAPGPASWSSGDYGASGLIEFEVVGVLKGPILSGPVRIPGTLVHRDDFNDRGIPFTFVRPGGRGGNCFAFGYRQGAEYLLFLRPGKETLAPYWAPLAAVNEQVRGSQDPWVAWVRGQLAGK